MNSLTCFIIVSIIITLIAISFINEITYYESKMVEQYNQPYNSIKKIYGNDLKYVMTFRKDYFKKLHNNNIKKKHSYIPNIPRRILIITYDNRKSVPYIDVHNENVQNYVNKWNYQYKFVNDCIYNTYWCKMYMVLDELNTDKYDYVMWMDSDTFINNKNISLHKILNQYTSDIFIGDDNNRIINITNAGVFIIKNSPIGKRFMKDCIDALEPECINANNTLNGMWAGTCYEQGIMNIMILKKYYKFTTILPKNIIYNKDKCNKEAFIMHLYNSSQEKRLKCFAN